MNHLWVKGCLTSWQSLLLDIERRRPVDVVTVQLKEIPEESPHLRGSVVDQVPPILVVHVELDHSLAEAPGCWLSLQPRFRAIDQNGGVCMG